MTITRICAICFLALLTPPAVWADRGAQGLMWNRSGLPAVFPLIVKSSSGADHFIRLHRVEDDRAVVAAYARGGAFFRVLVPPGTFRLAIFRGTDWQGAEALFGDGTVEVSLPDPVTFAVEGVGRKAGHILDLRRGMMRDVAICQRRERVWRSEDFELDPEEFSYPEYRLREGLCD